MSVIYKKPWVHILEGHYKFSSEVKMMFGFCEVIIHTLHQA
jgi:hypothetical protein